MFHETEADMNLNAHPYIVCIEICVYLYIYIVVVYSSIFHRCLDICRFDASQSSQIVISGLVVTGDVPEICHEDVPRFGWDEVHHKDGFLQDVVPSWERIHIPPMDLWKRKIMGTQLPFKVIFWLGPWRVVDNKGLVQSHSIHGTGMLYLPTYI